MVAIMKIRSLFTVLSATTILGLLVGVAHAQTNQTDQASESSAQEAQSDFAPEMNVEETAPPAPQGWSQSVGRAESAPAP